MASTIGRDRADSNESNDTNSTIYLDDSISNTGINRYGRPPSYGPMAAFLASSQEPRNNRDSMLPPLKLVKPRPYRADSPISESTPTVVPSQVNIAALQSLETASNIPYQPTPTTLRRLEPSTPPTFHDSSDLLTILNYSEPPAYRSKSPFRETSIVMPTPRKFVRFVEFDGEHMWPFDEVDPDRRDSDSIGSVRSGETDLSSDFQLSPTYEMQYELPEIRDSRWFPRFEDPRCEEDEELPQLSVVSESNDDDEEQIAFFDGSSIHQFCSRERENSDSTASSDSSRMSLETVDSYRRDHLLNVSKRPQSRQAEFFFMPNSELKIPTSTVEPTPSLVEDSGSSASAETIDVRDLNMVVTREKDDGLIETISLATVDDREFIIHSRSTTPIVVSPETWLRRWEHDGIRLAQRSQTHSKKPPFFHRIRPSRDATKEREKWWLKHPLTLAGMEQAISQDGKSPTGRHARILPDFYIHGRPNVPANSLQAKLALSRAHTEISRRPLPTSLVRYEGQESSVVSADSDWQWSDAMCDVFRSNAFRGKSLDISRTNTRLPLPGDKTWRAKIREPRIRRFLERWVKRDR